MLQAGRGCQAGARARQILGKCSHCLLSSRMHRIPSVLHQSERALSRGRLQISAVSTLNTDRKSQTLGSSVIQNSDSAHANTFVYTRFYWPRALAGEEISVWGSFNNWAKGIKLHRFSQDCDASVVLPLQPGNYEYKYVVDKMWTTAQFEPSVTTTDGSINNFRVVAPTIEFSIAAPGASQVLVVGDWDDWQYSLLMVKDAASGVFNCQAHLKPGQYSYYYVVDDEVVLNPDESYEVDSDRGAVHKDWSYLPDIFRIYYCTGWEDTVLHYRRSIKGQPPPKDFQEMPMVMPSSRKCEAGTWKMATIVPTTDDEQLEFYLSNGQQGDRQRVDKPGNAPLYCLPNPGSFKLAFGLVKPFPRGADSRIMVVSDLDGTMFGDVNSPDAFDSSYRFLQYWDNTQALAGSVLVFNTGRSLGQFVGLMRSCEGRVAVPDVLVTAVGTKVWKRKTANGLDWAEDMEWAAQLDHCWNLGTARKVADSLVRHYNNDSGKIYVADDGSEHQHRLAMVVDKSIQQHVTNTMVEAFSKENMEVRIIISGVGSHRYVDCVPVAAGKERALQYVRQQYGIPEHLCVAAGDSGNDILMLEGEHPGIVVGNAQGELLHWLVQRPQNGKVLMADAFFADGILEGLARHGLF